MKNFFINRKWFSTFSSRAFALLACLTLLVSTNAVSKNNHFLFDAQMNINSLRVGNKAIKEVFEQIEKSGEYLFIYYDNLADLDKKVSIDVQDKPIEDILDALFADTNLSYTIANRQISIIPKPSANAASPAAIKQNKKVRGVVKDEFGATMPGVTIIVKGTTRGVITDLNGVFEIELAPSVSLKASFLGYQDQEFTFGDKSEIAIQMSPKIDELAEVQVVAFGKQRRESVIGAISTVSVSNLKNPVGKLSTSLAGQLPGIVAVQRSGEPGTSADFWIRGIATFNGHNSPLVLVDGIERSLDLVDPEDIESFSILKDATATAVYGVRGANGIILVTTKRGKEGKINISARVEYGISSPLQQVKLATAEQWIDYYNDVSLESQGRYAYTEEVKQKHLTGTDPDLYPNVDWIKEMFKKNSNNQRVSLNISGGAKNIRYYVAGSAFFENGLLNGQKTKNYDTSLNYNRYNFRTNVDMDVTSSTVLSLSLANMYETKNRPRVDMWEYTLTVPNIATPIIYSDGTFATPHLGVNPWMNLNQKGFSTDFWNNTQTLFQVTQDFSSFVTEGLEGNVKFSWDAQNRAVTDRNKNPSTYYATGRDKEGNLIFHKNSDGSDYMTANSSSDGERTLSFEASVTYNRVFNESHRVGGLFLFNMRERILNKPSGYIQTFPYRNQGIAGRLTYSFKDTYFVEGNFGYNGSENFGPNKRFGFFPAVAVGYLISNEDYFKNLLPVISLVKLKASHGKVGNDKLNESVRFGFNTEMAWRTDPNKNYSFGHVGQNVVEALGTGRPGNPNISWENAKKSNIGLELGFFDKLTAQLDYFYEKRSNIFIEQQSIPSVVGVIQRVQLNKGLMKNQGFEVALEYHQTFNDFFVTGRANFTYNQNEVLYDDKPTPPWPYLSEAGQRFGRQLGLVALGLFESEEEIANSPTQTFGLVRPGDVKYKDINGDGKIDLNDRIPIGHPDIPAFTYGFGASAGWKNFDLSLFFQGIGEVTRFISGSHFQGTLNNKLGLGQIFREVAEERWTERNPNPNAKYPRMAMSVSSNNGQESTMRMRDGSFIRLKNVEFGYTLPKQLTKKIGLGPVRFYCQGVNLLTFSKFKLWDPELNTKSGQMYPQMKVINFGVNINI